MENANKPYYFFTFITDYFCRTPWTLNCRLCHDLGDAEKLQKPHSSFPAGPSLTIL